MNIVKSNCIPCNKCMKRTQHTVQGEHFDIYSEDRPDANETTKGYQILVCDKCRSISFREFVHFSEFGEFPGDLDPEDNLLPPRTRRKIPEWVTAEWITNPKIYKLLGEFYKALDMNLLWLASIGARTIFDVFAQKTVGDAGGFECKLKKLVSGNYINQTEGDRLNVLVEVGSASAHRGYQPSDEDIDVVSGILEAMLYRHLVEPNKLKRLDIAAQEVMDKVPKRLSTGTKKLKQDASL